ncbi:MAG: hypothetical protein AAF420_05700 [Pseudomonadota bacterium]
MSSSDSQFVTQQQRNGIAIIVVDNPPVNAMSVGVPRDSIAAIESANADDGVRGILLCAGGRGIWGGADIKMQGKQWPNHEPNLRALVDVLESSEKPTAERMFTQQHGGGLFARF